MLELLHRVPAAMCINSRENNEKSTRKEKMNERSTVHTEDDKDVGNVRSGGSHTMALATRCKEGE